MKKIAIFLLSVISLDACTNITQKVNSATNTMTNPAFVSGSATSYTHTVHNASIAALTSGSPPDLELSLSVNTSLAGFQALTQFCERSGTSRPCACYLTWSETNTVSGSSTVVSRTKKLALSEVQSGLVKCRMTEAFWNEITSGTSIRMNIVPVSPNTSGLNAQSIGYKKGTSIAPAGDFVDDTLTPFRNIYRYTCFSKRLNAYEVLNQYAQATTSGTPSKTANIMIASGFCPEGGSGCQTPRNGYSAQNYYRNLFIRSDKLGEINSTNARYDCPKVFESISYSAASTPTVPLAEQGKYWPLDTTFAVATTATSEWSVQIAAASILKKAGDPTTDDDAVASPTDRLLELGTNGGIAWKVMGYGKKPNANGTCGSIVDGNGRTRPLTRLRRYRVIYPSTFQNSGAVANDRPEADQVYIADRLVTDTHGTLTGNMIYGPKPCNFAWFDHEGVTNRNGISGINFETNFTGGAGSSIPIYRGTSKYYYDKGAGVEVSVNPDGRILPNIDRDGTVGGLNAPSCSAAIAVYDELLGVPSTARVLTSYFNRDDKIRLGNRDFYLNEIHVNPVDRWSPDYVEDIAFQACVPIADPYLEPPLHFYRDSSSKVAWCSKVYPTQNPYWLEMNSRKRPTSSTVSSRAINWGNTPPNNNVAQVPWFTSHANAGSNLDVYNTCSSTVVDKICEWTLGLTSSDYSTCKDYLGAATGASANRCDRTVMYDPNQDYRGFPLLANDADISEMLEKDLGKDKSYSCNFSVHSNPSKVNRDQPLSACCGVSAGTILLDSVSRLPVNQGGHLEPYINGLMPNIRFCGNPVE